MPAGAGVVIAAASTAGEAAGVAAGAVAFGSGSSRAPHREQ
jgi:hypothetical protein